MVCRHLIQLHKLQFNLQVSNADLLTGGIGRFSAQEIFGKISKVSHFYLGFLPDKYNNSQRVSLELSESDFENFDKTL